MITSPRSRQEAVRLFSHPRCDPPINACRINGTPQEHPDLLLDLLRVLELRLDHGRVIGVLRQAGHLPLIKDYLASVQVGRGRKMAHRLKQTALRVSFQRQLS